MLPGASRSRLLCQRPTIDIDAIDIEVRGPTKKGVAWTYSGQRAGRVHAALWAEAGLALAAGLTAGNIDGRPGAPGLLARAVNSLPPQLTGRPRLRADAGYFDGALAHAADEPRVDWAIAANPTSRAWTAYAQIPQSAWVSARHMRDAQVAVIDYIPQGWPADCYTIVRRVRIDATQISAHGRSRRRRTMHPDQLALALDGQADHAYAVGFIVTNLPTDTIDDLIAVQAIPLWHRCARSGSGPHSSRAARVRQGLPAEGGEEEPSQGEGLHGGAGPDDAIPTVLQGFRCRWGQCRWPRRRGAAC